MAVMGLAPHVQMALPLFGLGELQRSPFISTVSRTNAVVELTENGRQQAALLGLPGLEAFITFGATPLRAYYVREGELIFYAVVGNRLLKLAPNQPAVELGTLATLTGPAWIADNGTQLFINDGVTAWIYNTTTGVLTQITDPDYPTLARGGTYLQGRFWVYTTTGPNAGRVYASDQQNGLAWDALNFFTPESIPDGIMAVYRWYNDLVVFGRSSIEWWSGVSVSIPGQLGFQPVSGANIEVGLSGEQAYGRVGQRLFFLGRVNGEAGIYELVNYRVRKVSTPAVDADLLRRVNHAVAVGTGYLAAGHGLFQLTFPGTTAEQAVTWAYDVLTGLWCQRESYGQPYYRGLLATSSLDRIFISDAFTGTIWEMKDTVYTEGDDPLIFEVTGIHLLKQGNMLAVDAIQVDVETGLGVSTGQGSDPRAMLQVSKDGGRTWGTEQWVPLGKIGEYRRRALRRRLGAARDLAVRLRITDPVPRRVTGAYLRVSPGSS